MTELLKNINPAVYAAFLFIAPAVLLGLAGLLFKRYVAEWSTEERGFVGLEKHWSKIFYFSWAGGWGAAILAGVLSGGNIFAVFLFAILAYVLIFSSYTDIIVHKAPKEVARYGIVSALPIAALAIWQHGLMNYGGDTLLTRFVYFGANITASQLIALAVWLAIPIIMFFVSGGGLGMADIRLFVFFGVTLSWWVGIMGMFVMFFIANLIQIISFIPAQKYGWGQMITLKSGKTKRAVPFIPALAASFLIGGFYFVSLTM